MFKLYLRTLKKSIQVRKNDHDLSKVYRNASETFHLRVGHDLNSKSFLMEIAVFCTYLVILCIIGGRMIFSTPRAASFFAQSPPLP